MKEKIKQITALIVFFIATIFILIGNQIICYVRDWRKYGRRNFTTNYS